MEPEERNQIASLIQLVESEELAELSLRIGDEGLRIRRAEDRTTTVLRSLLHSGLTGTVLQGQGNEVSTASATSEPVSSEGNPILVNIISPMVGVFYRCPAPGADPFVEIGSMVEEGQTIGLVEAMKVFNEILAEVDGKVVAIPARNEQLVQHGDTLVIIERMEV